MFASMHLLSSETFIDLLGALWFHTEWRQKRCQVVIGLPFVLGSKDCQIEKKGVSGSWCHSLYQQAEGNNITAGIISAASADRTGTERGTRCRDGDRSLIILMSMIHWGHSVHQGINRAFRGMGTAEENSLFWFTSPSTRHMQCYENSMDVEVACCSWDIPGSFKTSVSQEEQIQPNRAHPNWLEQRKALTAGAVTLLRRGCYEPARLQKCLLACINRKLVEIQPPEDMQHTNMCLSVACPYLLWTSFKVI